MILIFRSLDMIILTTLYFILLTTSTLVAKPITQNTSENDIDLRSYLQSYGYLEEASNETDASLSLSSSDNSDNLRSAISNFQQFMGLNVTGVADEATKQQATRPRCGVRDTPLSLQNHPTEDDASDSSLWNKTLRAYRFGSFAPYKQISRLLQESIMDDAFYEWSKHVPLTFEKVCGTCSADIVIDFIDDKLGKHRDYDIIAGFHPKDLAHASLPWTTYPAFIHFNKQIIFTDSYNSTTSPANLFHVAVHEIGHALGLYHIKNNAQSVMAPSYPQPYDRTRTDYVPSIDQQSLQELYGKREKSVISSCSTWSTWPERLNITITADWNDTTSSLRKEDGNTVETANHQQLLAHYLLEQRQSYRVASHRLRQQSSVEKLEDSSLRLRFHRGRTDVRSFKTSGSVIEDEFGETQAIFFDKFDNFYVSDYANNRVLKYEAGATKQQSTIVAEGLNAPRGLYITNDGNRLYVADNKGVHRFKLNRKQTYLGASTLLFLLEPSSEIHSMIVDEADFDTIYLYDTTRRRIQRCRHHLHNWQCETIISLIGKIIDDDDVPEQALMVLDAEGDLSLLVESTISVIFQYKHNKNGCRPVSTATTSPPPPSTTPKNDYEEEQTPPASVCNIQECRSVISFYLRNLWDYTTKDFVECEGCPFTSYPNLPVDPCNIERCRSAIMFYLDKSWYYNTEDFDECNGCIHTTYPNFPF